MARLQMLAIAIGSAAAGFLTTFTLLHLHVQAMWLRYGVSVIVAYGEFLLLLRVWTLHYRAHPDRAALLREMKAESPKASRDDSDFSFLDLLDVFDFELECLVWLVAILLPCIAALYLFWTVPGWTADLVLDGIVGATAYSQLRRVHIQRTVAPFVCLFILFVGAGLVCHAYAPEANSIGGVIRHAAQQSR